MTETTELQTGSEGDARVVVSYGRRVLIDIGDGVARRCGLRGRRLKPLCGDRVRWAFDDDLLLTEVAPRRNELLRHDVRAGARAIAANIDQLVTVVTAEPAVTLETVDRYIAGAEILGMRPLILRNKMDLGPPPGSTEDWALFDALGYSCIDVSAQEGSGLDALRSALAGQVSIFVGPSGVGKSSLLDALDPELELRTQTLSSGSGEGRHTTTATRLYQIPGGLEVIDSPGVRDFRLWPMPQQTLQQGFKEIIEHAQQCRFPNCSHTHEPGCAVSDAIADGGVTQRRYDSYRLLSAQLAA